MDTSKDAINYIIKLHRNFIDCMHTHFGVKNQTYVEEFFCILNQDDDKEKDKLGIYGIRMCGKPYIGISYGYQGYSKRDSNDYYGRLSLETTLFHESAHHLHHTYHNRKFNNIINWELVIDCAVIHYFHINNMQEHLENLSVTHEIVAKKLYRELKKESELRFLLTASEEDSLIISTRILGQEFKNLEDCIKYIGKLNRN